MSSNVVNFSDLDENEQQKYVEFFLQNKFIFTEDRQGDTFNATIKINMQPSSSSSSIPTLQQQNKQISLNESSKDKSDLINSKENHDQMKQLRTSNGGRFEVKKATNSQKENVDIVTQRKQNSINNRYSKSPIQKKLPNQQNTILSNITNKYPKQQSSITSSQQLKEGLNKSKIQSASHISALDACLQLSKKNQEISENVDDPLKQSAFLETKKQQMLEKLQIKLSQANKLAEMEEQQQKEQFLIDIVPQQIQENAVKKGDTQKLNGQLDQLTNRNRRNSSNVLNKSQQNIPQKSNRDNNKENNQDEGRNRKISQDLMLKNKEFICKLQEKNKQKQQKPVRKSVSPAITPRKHQLENTNHQNDEIKMHTAQNLTNGNSTFRRHSNIQQSGSSGILQKQQQTRGRSNTQENNKSPLQNQKQTQGEKPPSTFEQIMSKQSQLINSVCGMLPNKKKIQPNIPLNSTKQSNNKTEELFQAISPNPRSPQYGSSAQNSANSQSSSQRYNISSINRFNSKTIPDTAKNTTPPKNNHGNINKKQISQNPTKQPENKVDSNICFEFNSFGSPCNTFEVNQNIHQDQQPNQFDNCSKINKQQLQQQQQQQQQSKQDQINQNPQQKRNSGLSYDDDQDDEFKLYNIQSKRNRRQDQLGSSLQSSQSFQNGKSQFSNSQKGVASINHSHISDVSDTTYNILHTDQNSNSHKQNNNKKIQHNNDTENENEYLLTEIRAFTDSSLALRPTKMILPQVYKCIEELYQAKFYDNTLRMKMNSNSQRNKKAKQGYTNELNMQLEVQPYEISFSEFTYEYFKEKYIASKKVSEQHLINLIVSLEFYIKNSSKYSPNQILPIETFVAFIQNIYQKEELIFYLFVREMLLKYTQNGFDSNNTIFETQNIELSLEECQHVLEQVYGGNEQKIIDRFMYRLTDTLMEQKDTNDYNINATFFLNLALQDYIEGKNNKIYESGGQNESFSNQQPEYIEENTNETGLNTGEIVNFNKNNMLNSRNTQNMNSMNSFEKWEYTFEQSFGEATHLPSQLLGTKKFSLFSPKNDLEDKIWEKMIQKISDFIELVINDNYNEFTIKEKKAKFTSVEKIVTKKVNKMMGALFDQDQERWYDLLCITHPSPSQQENLETIRNILQNLQKKQLNEICNSEISHFCKIVLQTKELSKAIGKLLVCVLMPDNQNS